MANLNALQEAYKDFESRIKRSTGQPVTSGTDLLTNKTKQLVSRAQEDKTFAPRLATRLQNIKNEEAQNKLSPLTRLIASPAGRGTTQLLGGFTDVSLGMNPLFLGTAQPLREKALSVTPEATTGSEKAIRFAGEAIPALMVGGPAGVAKNLAFGGLLGGAGAAISGQDIGTGITEGARRGVREAQTLALTSTIVDNLANSIPALKQISSTAIKSGAPKLGMTAKEALGATVGTITRKVVKAATVETLVESVVYGARDREENERLADSIADEVLPTLEWNVKFAALSGVWDSRKAVPIVKDAIESSPTYQRTLGSEGGRVRIGSDMGRDDLSKAMQEKLGPTSNIREALYINDDGSLLGGRKTIVSETGGLVEQGHSRVPDLLSISDTPAEIAAKTRKIEINTRGDEVDLRIYGQPTQEQAARIKDIVDNNQVSIIESFRSDGSLNEVVEPDNIKGKSLNAVVDILRRAAFSHAGGKDVAAQVGENNSARAGLLLNEVETIEAKPENLPRLKEIRSELVKLGASEDYARQQTQTVIDAASAQQVINTVDTDQTVKDSGKFTEISSNKPDTSTAKKVSSDLEPLLQEARKYDSAEEFVKAQKGNRLFRGGERFDAARLNDEGLPLTYSNRVAEQFARNKNQFAVSPAGKILGKNPGQNIVETYYLSPDAKVATRSDVPENVFKAYKEANPLTEPDIAEPIINKWAKDNGYDAVDFRTLGNQSASEQEVKILNTDVIKTKQQLTDIYNQAKGTNTVKQMLTNQDGKVQLDAEISLRHEQKHISLPQEQKAALEKIYGGFEAGRQARSTANEPVHIKTTTKLKAELLDRLAPVDEIVDTAKKRGIATVNMDGLNPYGKMQLLNGISGKAEVTVRDIMQEPLMANKERLNDLSALSLLLREGELIKEGADTSLSNKEIADAMDGLRTKYGNDGFDELLSGVGKLNEGMTKVLTDYKDAGMISQEQFDAIMARPANQRYVPFEVVDYIGENVQNDKFGGKSYNVSSETNIKALKGSERLKASPLEAMPKKITRMVSVAEKNRAMQQFINIGRNNPDVMGDLIKQYDGGIVPKGFDKVSVFFDGNKQDWLVPSEVAGAIKASDAQTSAIINRLLTPSANLLRQTATGVNIGFMLANMPRDLQDAFLSQYTEQGFKGVVGLAFNLPRGIASAMKQDSLYQEWLGNGGGRSTLSRQFFDDPALTIKQIANADQKGGILKAIENGIRITEEGTRLAKFKSDIDLGYSPESAALNSRRITLDFSAGGDTIKQLNLWVPYLNAAFQSTKKMLDLAKTDPKRMAVGGAILYGVPAVMAYMNNRKYRDFADIEDWERDTYWMWMTRDRTPQEVVDDAPLHVIKIPKGWISQIYGNVTEHFMQYADQDAEGKRSLDQFATDMLEQLSPVGLPVDKERTGRTLSRVLPTALRVPAEVFSNKSFFTGRDIVPQSLQDVAPSEQYKSYTSPTLVAIAQSDLGRRLNLSPLAIEGALRSGTGSVSEQVLNIIDEALVATTDIENVPGLDVDAREKSGFARITQPVTRRFSGSYGGKQEQQQFDTVEQLRVQTATENLTEKRIAEKLYKDITSTTDVQKRREILLESIRSGEMNKDVLDNLLEIYTQKAQGYTTLDKSLSTLRADQRAKFILLQLEKMGGRQEKIAYLQDLSKKGLLTETVIKEMAALSGTQ